MKNTIYFLIAVALLMSCSGPKDQFTINGQVAGTDTGMVYLQKFDTGQWLTVDSTRIEKGKFTFTGKIALPEMWHIALQEKEVFVPLFIENGAIEVTIYPDSIEKSTIKGSPTHAVYEQYLATVKPVDQEMEKVYGEWKAARTAGDTAAMEVADSVSTVLDARMKELLKTFILSNGKSVVAPYLVTRNSWQFELPELDEIAAAFDTSLAQSQYAQTVMKRIGILQSVAVGQIAPDFTMNDSLGNPVSLSSLKGKVLLVDFWASWCGPCRAENPNVVKAYKAFNKKGFDILGVSFDQNREKWLKAVKADQLTWHHVSDLKGWGNSAGKLYGVNSIPASVLLDKDMRIVARNLRGEELIAKLTELLGAPEKK